MCNMPVSKTRIRHLNRRQRKKLRVGEFQEFIFQVAVTFKSAMDAADHDAFIDSCIGFMDAKGLSMWGMGGRLPISETVAWIQKRGRGSPAQSDRDALVTWLLERPDVATAIAGAFEDGWHVNGKQIDVLPKYPPDDGPLSAKQIDAVRREAAEQLPKGKLISKKTLFA